MNAQPTAASADVSSASRCAGSVKSNAKAKSDGSHIISISPITMPSHSRTVRPRRENRRHACKTPNSSNAANTTIPSIWSPIRSMNSLSL